jgi:hypothetical protein
MIMLRIKISPQATITIQSIIPKIIISLILVTFSYAIVGLLIDFSQVIANLGISLIYNITGNKSSISDFAIWGKNARLVNNNNGWDFVHGLIIAWTGNTFWGQVAAWILGGLGFLVGVGVILVLRLILSFKLFFGLVKCYITILLKTIIGPLEICLGAIPNLKTGFGTWFISIFANLMVFPIVKIFLVLALELRELLWHKYVWVPDTISGVDTGSGRAFIAVAVSFAAWFILAKLPKIVPEAIFKIKDELGFGAAIGENMKPIKTTSKAIGIGGLNVADTTSANRIATPGSHRPSKIVHGTTQSIKWLFGRK